MMNWSQKAEVAFSGPYVKFANGTECIVQFIKEPYERNFTINGKEKISYEFTVKINEVEKTMSVTSRRLMDMLIAEERRRSLIGRTLRIKAIGNGTARYWEVEGVKDTL